MRERDRESLYKGRTLESETATHNVSGADGEGEEVLEEEWGVEVEDVMCKVLSGEISVDHIVLLFIYDSDEVTGLRISCSTQHVHVYNINQECPMG